MSGTQRHTNILYAAASLWNLSYAMAVVIVPLYAYQLGLSAAAIGGFIGGVMLVQLATRLLGGQLSDQFGERTLLYVCFYLMALANAIYLLAGFTSATVTLLILGQAINVLSRGFYFVSSQSYASRVGSGPAETRLGRLVAVNHASQLPGFIAAGFIVQLVGFPISFGVGMLTALTASIVALGLPALPRRTRPDRKGFGRTLTAFAKSRATLVGFTCAYFARIPISVMESFYPIYLGELGFSEGWIGTMASVIIVGPVIAGFIIARLITPANRPHFFMYSVGMLAISLFLSSQWTAGWVLALLILMLGTGGGLLNILYQVAAADGSGEEDRGMAMAVMGLGFTLAGLTVPVILGFLVESGGFKLAFSVLSGVCLLVAAFGRVLFATPLSRTADPVDRPAS